MAWVESPLDPYGDPDRLIEIGEVQDSLHKEPSAELSTGEVSTEERRCSWTEPGLESTPAKRCIGFTCSMLRVRSSFPERSKTTRPTSLLSSTKSCPLQRSSSGPSISQEAARLCSWDCYGSVSRGSSTSLASPWTVPATLILESPRPMPAMPTSSPTPGSDEARTPRTHRRAGRARRARNTPLSTPRPRHRPEPVRHPPQRDAFGRLSGPGASSRSESPRRSHLRLSLPETGTDPPSGPQAPRCLP